jgi:hypothetical protein
MSETPHAVEPSHSDSGVARGRGRALERLHRTVGPGSSLGVFFPLVLAALASLLTELEEMRRALWPLNWSRNAPIEWSAVAYLLLFLLALILAEWDRRERKAHDSAEGVRLKESEERRERAETDATEARKELIERTRRIEEMGRVMPPSDFQSGFDEASRYCHGAFIIATRSPRQDRDEAMVIASIRTVLFTAANLVRRFDRSAGDAVFSANIMRFYPAASIRRSRKDLEAFAIVEDGVDLARTRGVLDLNCALSASTATLANAPDRQIRRLVLTVPNPSDDGEIGLPGAPTAFCRREMDVCPDVFEIPVRCMREGSGSKTVADSIRRHFNGPGASHIRSFLSIPLLIPQDLERDPVGVLNINCSITGMLGEPARQEMIMPNLRSLLWPLPEMLNELDRLRRQTGRRDRV